MLKIIFIILNLKTKVWCKGIVNIQDRNIRCLVLVINGKYFDVSSSSRTLVCFSSPPSCVTGTMGLILTQQTIDLVWPVHVMLHEGDVLTSLPILPYPCAETDTGVNDTCVITHARTVNDTLVEHPFTVGQGEVRVTRNTTARGR